MSVKQNFLDYVLADSRGHSLARAPLKSQALNLLGLIPENTHESTIEAQQQSLIDQLTCYKTKHALHIDDCKELILYIRNPDDIHSAQTMAQQLNAKSKLTIVLAPLKNPVWRLALNATFVTEIV
jgi:hypothetical protein